MARPDNKYKTPQEILDTDDLKPQDLYVEQWGTFVQVIGLTKNQQLRIREQSIVNGEYDVEKSQMGMWREGVLQPKFEEHQLPLLFEKSAGAVDAVLKTVLRLSGMDEEALKEKRATFPAGAVEAAPVRTGGEAE